MTGDRELIEALRQGSNDAWTELVNRYLKLVCHVVRRTLSTYGRRNEQDVEDVAHEFFTHLCRDQYRALATIGAPWDLKAWLAIGARRRAIDHVRKRQPASVSLETRQNEDGMALSEAVAAKPAAEADPAEQQAAVAEALGSLSPKERLIVQLFYLKGLKYKEISKITGVNMNSISPTLMRAVEKMQKRVASS